MGAQIGPNINANSRGYNFLSPLSNISFTGFINENYYLIGSKEENLLANIEISHAFTKNPITNRMEAFISFLLKSKYDGVGNRSPIDLSIALDTSNTMRTIDINHGQSRISLAKEAVGKLISAMDEKTDRMSLITFNQKTKKIFGLSNKKTIQQEYENSLNCLETRGEADLCMALSEAMNNLNSTVDVKKVKRIILITDGQYSDIIGADSYEVPENGPEKRLFDGISHVNKDKMRVLHECGEIPTVEGFKEVKWGFFMTWHTKWLIYDGDPDVQSSNTDDQIRAVYLDDYVLTLEDIPNLK